MGELSDEALLAGLGAGDGTAAVAFVRRFQSRVFGIASAILRDPGLAEDVSQRAFERAWSHASAYDARRGSVETWLATITRHLAIDAVRVRRPAPVEPESLEWLLGAGGPEPERKAESADDRRAVVRALHRIPPEQARAVVMGALYGMPYAQVAEIEGVPVNTVKTRVRTGLRRMRQQLSPAELGEGGGE